MYDRLSLQKEDLKSVFRCTLDASSIYRVLQISFHNRNFARKRVCIRLLDGPLQDLLGGTDASAIDLALHLNQPVRHTSCSQLWCVKLFSMQVAVVRAKMEEVHDRNPALGLRGCR